MKAINYFRRQITFLFGFSVICVLLVSSTFFIGEKITSFTKDEDASVGVQDKITIIIDPGHGGLDGGASTDDGVLEKDLNLAVSKKLAALLGVSEFNVVMTRDTDIMLADSSSSHKKRDDLNTRLHMADNYENCVFVSIHMNKFPVAKYSGLQVYYSKNNELGKVLADTVQQKTAQFISADNARMTKAADSSIYLLHNIKVPAVLVECGFLSNPEEAALLASEDYQDKLAAVICSSILDFVGENMIKN